MGLERTGTQDKRYPDGLQKGKGVTEGRAPRIKGTLRGYRKGKELKKGGNPG